MRVAKYLVSFLYLILALSACSTSIPLSESFIYISEKKDNNSAYSIEDTTIDKIKKRGGSISFNTSVSAVETHVDSQKEAKGKSAAKNPANVSGGYAIANKFDFYYLGYNFGINSLSVNFTFETVLDTYFTISYAPFSAYEFIAQYPVYVIKDKNIHGGIAIGPFYKNDLFRYEVESEDYFDFNPFESASVRAYGGRVMVHFGKLSEQRGLMGLMGHGFINVGYSPTLDTEIMYMGISLGFTSIMR